MRQYRLRGVLALIALIALSMALGGWIERARQATIPKPAPPPRRPSSTTERSRAFNFYIGAFW